MAKEALKTALLIEQEGLDAITGDVLPEDLSLIDTHRLVPKLDGGTYDDLDNVLVIDPVVHMKEHGTYRVRDEALDDLKTRFDFRGQTMKLKNKINNQLLAYNRRTDSADPEVREFLDETLLPVKNKLKDIDKGIAKAVAVMEQDHPLIAAAMGVPGLGPISVGMLAVYIDLEKADSASSLWSYVGLHKAAHERYQKDPEQQARREARGPAWYNSDKDVPTGWGGNKTVRTQLYVTAGVMLKLASKYVMPYASVYRRTRARLEVSEKITKTYAKSDGTLIEIPWSDPKNKGHRHGAAIRALIKHLLADYWFVGRELAGLPTRPLYVQEKLRHTGIVSPGERGWVWG